MQVSGEAVIQQYRTMHVSLYYLWLLGIRDLCIKRNFQGHCRDYS